MCRKKYVVRLRVRPEYPRGCGSGIAPRYRNGQPHPMNLPDFIAIPVWLFGIVMAVVWTAFRFYAVRRLIEFRDGVRRQTSGVFDPDIQANLLRKKAANYGQLPGA